MTSQRFSSERHDLQQFFFGRSWDTVLSKVVLGWVLRRALFGNGNGDGDGDVLDYHIRTR